MLEYIIKITVNTLYIAIPASLLRAFASGAIGRLGDKNIARGAGLGLIAAIVYAVLKRNTGFAVREYYDLGILIPSILAAASALFAAAWSALRPEYISARGRGAFIGIMAFCAALFMSAYVMPNILLYPFEFSVGMDTIFNTEFMFKVIGYSFGILLVLLTAYALSRVASQLGERVLASAFGLSFAVLMAKEILTIAQISLGRNLIPRYKWLTRAVIWAITRENAFLYAMMAIAALAAVSGIIRVASSHPSGSNPAQVRRSKFLARKQVRFCVSSALGVIISLFVMTMGASYANRRVELSPPVEYPATGEEIVIPLDKVSDGSLHRFVHKVKRGSSSVDVRYIVIKKNDTAYGVGLDACDVCGPTGYYQRKGQVVCILCDVVMNKSTIGLPGGCNPVPLKFEISGGSLVIKTSELEAEARRF
jgi:uncharacterized membrane protein